MSDEYAVVARGKLKLKTDSNRLSKTLKKKNKDKKRREQLESGLEHKTNTCKYEEEKISNNSQTSASKMTKAELSFKKMQEKMQEKRIMEKASTTHKQRVEKFNEHLDNLTEHFDIPKVSWTK